MTEVALRPETADDGAFVLEVYASTRERELELVPWTPDQRAAFVAQQHAAQDAHWRAHYANLSRSIVLVDGRPAGRLYVARWERELRVVDVALLALYRGGGVGTRLMSDVLDEAAQRGVPVTLHVASGNRAERLYERLGFRPVSGDGVYTLMMAEPQPKTAS